MEKIIFGAALYLTLKGSLMAIFLKNQVYQTVDDKTTFSLPGGRQHALFKFPAVGCEVFVTFFTSAG